MNVFITQLTWVWNVHVEKGPHCLPSFSILRSYFGPINLLEVTIWNQKSWASQRSRYTQWSEEGVRPPEARVSGCCELPAWVLGSDPRSSVQATSTLTHRTILPAPLNMWLLSTVSHRWWAYKQGEVTSIWKCDSTCQGKKNNISPLHEISRY